VQPAIDFDEVVGRLNERFRNRYDGDPSSRTRMLGIVFARPSSSLAKSEIIPQLNDWHYRSGEHIDFFFAGYTYPHPIVPGYIEVAIPGGDPWLYSSERFDVFRKAIETRTSWKYGGGSEILLTNARFDGKKHEARIDFTSAISCQLDTMKSDQAIQSVERFFESIFRFAETSNDEDPTWGFSDAQGLKVAGSALKRAVLNLLPKTVGEEYRKAEHFVVQDVARG